MKTKYKISEETTLKAIKAVVCDVFQVTFDDIKGKVRTSEITEPRHICLALGFSFTKNSQTAIGAYFGGKDHAMTNYAVKTLLVLYKTNEVYRNNVNKVIKMVSLMTAISFSIQDVKNAAEKKKSSSARRPCITDMLNQRMLVLLTGKNTDFFEEVLAMRKIYEVIKMEAA